MKKPQLIKAIANHAQLSKSEACRALVGSFEAKGRNPQTGAEINITATNLPGFKAGKSLKEAMNA